MIPRAGAIPASIGNLTNLKELHLSRNELEGASVYVQFYTEEANFVELSFCCGSVPEGEGAASLRRACSSVPAISPELSLERACVLVLKRSACKPSSWPSENVPCPFRACSRTFPLCSHQRRTASTPARVLRDLRLETAHGQLCCASSAGGVALERSQLDTARDDARSRET